MEWHRVAALDELDEGSVKSVEVAGTPVALTHFEGQYGAFANACPHMGGPLGEGSIEYGFLVCPWHGREYHPTSGQCEGFDDHARAYAVEVRDDGVYVSVEP